MNKVLSLEYEGKTYTLEFDRKTVVQLEAEGFVPSECGDKPMTMIPMLVHGAFRKHHKDVKRVLSDEIFKTIPQKEKFVEMLVEMYIQPIESLMDEPSEEETKNVTWKAQW